MYGKDVSLFCLAYIIGLLIASGIHQYWLTILIFALITGALAWKFASYHQWWGLRSRSFLVIIIMASLAFISFDLRFPTPNSNDVSKIIPPEANGINATVIGKVLNSPTLNRAGKLRFWLATEAVKQESEKQKVTGKLYITIPASLGKGVDPNSQIEVSGYLYQPQIPKNPGQFDFSQYLSRNGAFAGLSSKELKVLSEDSWGFWRLRDRVVNVHKTALLSPKGELISSMVLGRKAVDLPYPIQEQFLQAGLAHILAASGFHVSLLLGLVLGITQRFKVSLRFFIGVGILFLYVGLTGLQPSILRASLMGIAGLLGLLTERKVNATRSLLVIATILLLINPLWIIDLGFQFSFLATLGLIVTLPPLLKQLDFLPPTIASLIAVPIAVFPWVFPLQLFYLGTVATYSIILNILVTPLAVILILGGMLSGFLGLLIPELGSAIAQLLAHPTQWLILIVSGFNQLPGSYILFGKIALWQLLAMGSIIVYIWQFKPRINQGKVAIFVAIAIITLPLAYQQLTFQQVTVFATDKPLIIFLQNRGQTTLINCGDPNTIRYTILPFLQQQGIQKIDYAIALSEENEWHNLLKNIRVKTLFNSRLTQPEISKLSNVESVIQKPFTSLKIKDFSLTMIDSVLSINLKKQQWGVLQHPTQRVSNFPKLSKKVDVLLWEGKELSDSWLEQLKPQSAIAITDQISQKLEETIKQKGMEFYFTSKHGAIQWTPNKNLTTFLN